MRGACFTSAILNRFGASVTYLFICRYLSGTQGISSTNRFIGQRRKRGLVILNSSSRERGLWGALLVLALLAAHPADARTHHSDAWAREHFASAERMREALNGRPPIERTRRDYQRVVNAYRLVYLGAPSSSKADPSVVSLAETLVEMGRRFEDDSILNKAILEYKFLRREYPGSKYRADGLFTVAEIYKDDLNDSKAARASFQEFLHHYPHNRLADDARQAILEIDQQALAENNAQTSPAEETARPLADAKNDDEEVSRANRNSASPVASTRVVATRDDPRQPHSGRLPRVTDIRHWSTPDYTRIAIDVEGDVKFSSQRIATPARIFFDLNGTKLASTLVGKSFDVDDGFLKKVRVAQFAPGRTRVVLEVDNLSDYDAFLLPNPYRLIIDIHGKNWNGRQRREAEESLMTQNSGRGAAAVGGDADSSSTEAKSDALASSEPATPLDTEPEAKTTQIGIRRDLGIGSTKAPTAVVKKVVDADDDENAELSEPAPAKRSIPASRKNLLSARNSGIPKKIVDNDLSDETEALNSGLAQAEADERTEPQAGPRRTLASSRARRATHSDIREAQPTASGDRSLIRALGLKIGKIVIDPGHGGHDTGTIGPNGLEEKDLVLEVSRRLGKLLETRLGAEVVYTRKDDTFIPLETRTAIANQARADLFVSIHANSSHDAAARGVETYYLNFTSSPEALEVAARENAVSEKSIYELQDLVKKIALKEKIEESREFAGDVQSSLHSGLAMKSPAIRDRGVKKAPFIVLIGANMPSILAEISFVSNPTDEHRLATSEYRERIAESLYRGIAKYVNGLSGVKVASKMDKAGGQ
jgi:N-acetylmuramoyl-L-alanine amidase